MGQLSDSIECGKNYHNARTHLEFTSLQRHGAGIHALADARNVWQEISAFYELFSDIRSVNQQAELDALNDYHIHLITKEELAERISDISLNGYLSARKEFCRRYGYYPIKVPVYGLDDLDVVRFDREEEQP